MKLRWSVVVCLGLVAALVANLPRSIGQDAEKKKIKLKVILPQDNATLTVDGKKMKQSGKVRTIDSPLLDTKNNYTYTVKAMWEPNNYTKITRTYMVVVDFKKDVVEVDMTKENPDKKYKDDIVVRYVPTPNEVVDAMCKLAKVSKEDVVYDLGCGDGRMVCRAIANHGAKRGIGVDIDPDRVKDSKETAKTYKVENKVEFRQGDVLKIDDIPNANVVLLYMGNDINLRLRPILKAKLTPGSRVVSHRFTMGDWEPTKTEKLTVDGEEYEIHLWVIGDEKKKKAD